MLLYRLFSVICMHLWCCWYACNAMQCKHAIHCVLYAVCTTSTMALRFVFSSAAHDRGHQLAMQDLLLSLGIAAVDVQYNLQVQSFEQVDSFLTAM